MQTPLAIRLAKEQIGIDLYLDQCVGAEQLRSKVNCVQRAEACMQQTLVKHPRRYAPPARAALFGLDTRLVPFYTARRVTPMEKSGL